MFCTECGGKSEESSMFCEHCGAKGSRKENGSGESQKISQNAYTQTLASAGGGSYFDGGLFSFLGWVILGAIITVCTFGICYPWALCMIYGWKINHTVVEGKRLKFTGRAIGLFGNWIIWLLLCVVTFGIYGFWLYIALEKWKAKNTTFA